MNLSSRFLDLGGRFKRIDFAFDDHAKITSIPTTYQTWKEGHVVTPYKEIQWITSHGRSPNSEHSSLFIGSRTSDTCIRVYEKQYDDELKFTGEGYEEAGYQARDHYVRWELEVKNKTAHKTVLEVISNAPGNLSNERIVTRFRQKALGLLTSRLSFRRLKPGKNVSRAVNIEWWRQFIEYLDAGDSDASNEPSISANEDMGTSGFKVFAPEYREIRSPVKSVDRTRLIQRQINTPVRFNIASGCMTNELKFKHQLNRYDDDIY